MKAPRPSSLYALLSIVSCAQMLFGCAGTPSALRAREGREKLRAAMAVPVPDKDKRDEQSHLLADSVAYADLERMDRGSVRTALGEGKACTLSVCAANGFYETDWYYELGILQNEKVKQLPLLLLGFDLHDRVTHVFTLTTH